MGLKPVFIDTNLSDLALDYNKLRSAVTTRTRAIFVAHLLGFPANISKIKEIISKRKNIVLLEDCCEAQGATINGVKVGNFGIAGTFSFYWGHHMTTVEGGMICTNNEDLYKLLVLKRSHGLARELPVRYHVDLKEKYRDIDFNFLFLTDGFNVRNTEFNAVLGLEQLTHLDDYIAIRNHNYNEFLNMCRRYSRELIIIDVAGMSSFVLPFLFRERRLKEKFQEAIRQAGIESRPIISGNLLRQPYLKKYHNSDNYPNADFIHSNAFYIGNNQFVDRHRLSVLSSLMESFFSSHCLYAPVEIP